MNEQELHFYLHQGDKRWPVHASKAFTSTDAVLLQADVTLQAGILKTAACIEVCYKQQSFMVYGHVLQLQAAANHICQVQFKFQEVSSMAVRMLLQLLDVELYIRGEKTAADVGDAAVARCWTENNAERFAELFDEAMAE
jgi:hypothetical protein